MMGFLKKFHPYLILAVALLVFVAPLYFGMTLTSFSDTYAIPPWSHLQPPGWFHSKSIDASPIYFFNPSDILNRALLRAGDAFTWNPFVGFGTPWLGVMQGAPYFPPKLIPLLWPDYWRGQDIMLIVMFLTAGVGNYLLLRSMGVGRDGAIFSGLAYMLCQRLFLIVNMPAFTIECLLPLMLYAVNEMVKRRSFRFALLAGLVGGTQFLGGFPEASFMVGLVSGLFFVWLVFRTCHTSREIMHAALLGVVVAALSLAIAGFQLTEFVKLLLASNSAHTANYGTVVKEPFWLLPLFLPNFYGVPFQSFWFSGIGPNDHMPLSLFCGISTVLLAIMALLWSAAVSRTYIWFFAMLLFLFVGYDYGFPILKLIGYLPIINMMSTAWNAFVIPLALSVLAGFGFQSLQQRGTNLRLVLGVAIYCAIVAWLCLLIPTPKLSPIILSTAPLIYVIPAFTVAAVLARRLKTRSLSSHLLFCLIVIESYLCASAFGFLHYYGPQLSSPPSLVWLKKNNLHDRLLGVYGMFPANTLLPDRIRDFRHLDAMYPKLYVDYANAIWPGAQSNVYQIGNPEWHKFDDPLLDLAAVKYVALHEPPRNVPASFDTVYSDAEVTIYRNNRAFARARYVPNALPLPERLTPAIMKERIKDLRIGVFLEEGIIPPPPNRSCPAPVLPPVMFLQDDPSQIRMRVDAPCDGYVVLADLFYPGWKANVNAHDAEIYKANYAFRAVAVKTGPNEIVMTYSPTSWRFGVPLAAAAYLGVLIAGLLYLGRRFRGAPAAV